MAYPNSDERMTPWTGGERPVPRNVLVAGRLRSGTVFGPLWADELTWKHGQLGITCDDVVAFRVVNDAPISSRINRAQGAGK